ncbi:endonuclease [Elizabethkingia argentiflava]|uniref:Endonuclease n=1 Tax=Elizabethkingia argenteiflava TaxID=2681556 RepID=A0A845PUS0_9FLAO|nr:endonuclease/exonuclease/phosphatase family protein [Elizabethkingia argenteiflava]NAW50636.1 endonuclease [Elizabethkingia argenteiflava]
MRIIRFIFTLLHLVVFFALSAMLLNSMVSPKVFKWLNFLSLAFPILITVYVMLTIIWILNFKKRAIVFLLGLLMFFNPIRRWINYNDNSHQKGNLKVITYNVHSAPRIPALKAFLESENPDIIFLQEKAVNSKNKLELSAFKYIVESTIVEIYSKFPVKNSGELVKDKNNGHALFADIDINGTTIRFINIYLEPFYLHKEMLLPTRDQKVNEEKAKKLEARLAESFRLHEDQIADILPAIKNSPYPIILGGDFNSVPNSYEYYHLGENLIDAFMEVGSGSGTSFHDYKMPIRIDYLFSSPSIKATHYRVKRDIEISDHFPVISHFKIK